MGTHVCGYSRTAAPCLGIVGKARNVLYLGGIGAVSSNTVPLAARSEPIGGTIGCLASCLFCYDDNIYSL